MRAVLAAAGRGAGPAATRLTCASTGQLELVINPCVDQGSVINTLYVPGPRTITTTALV